MILLLVTYSPIPHSDPPRLEIAPLGRLGRARRVTKPPPSPLPPPPGVGAALARPALDSGERKSLSQLTRSELQHALSRRQGVESPGSRPTAAAGKAEARREGQRGWGERRARAGAGAPAGRPRPAASDPGPLVVGTRSETRQIRPQQVAVDLNHSLWQMFSVVLLKFPDLYLHEGAQSFTWVVPVILDVSCCSPGSFGKRIGWINKSIFTTEKQFEAHLY
ncbi:uncharacterized protein LOC101723672 isoform X3 [Heterocephalus glaber]|uniref:Uncharacterized protein LOC101723672 isoform X3 n=1 Tax=Heterocephalus glaber TaxID=10181 RepID=A0AAX6SSH3_HETGA|nr:uncharacterized protein LOC101723672 isoform X3 [Heterocephalus glaber]